jgi:hypothetical protein
MDGSQAIVCMHPQLVRSVISLCLLMTGCGSIGGPSIEFTAPRITGKAVDALTGTPIRGARVGRTVYTWKGPGGEFRKAGEEMLLLQSLTYTDKNGDFNLASKRAAMLFRFGDDSLNLRLVIQSWKYQTWMTNYSVSNLSTNRESPEPHLDPGEIPLIPRR